EAEDLHQRLPRPIRPQAEARSDVRLCRRTKKARHHRSCRSFFRRPSPRNARSAGSLGKGSAPTGSLVRESLVQTKLSSNELSRAAAAPESPARKCREGGTNTRVPQGRHLSTRPQNSTPSLHQKSRRYFFPNLSTSAFKVRCVSSLHQFDV